jgi:hypothetical protein
VTAPNPPQKIISQAQLLDPDTPMTETRWLAYSQRLDLLAGKQKLNYWGFVAVISLTGIGGELEKAESNIRQASRTRGISRRFNRIPW